MGDPRRTYRYRVLRAALRKQRKPCYICGLDIDYTASKAEPLSFTADHVKPVTTHPELALVASNLKAAHYRCNTRRQDGAIKPELGQVSRSW